MPTWRFLHDRNLTINRHQQLRDGLERRLHRFTPCFRLQQDLPVGFRPGWVDGGSQSSWPVAGVDDVDVTIRTSIKVGSGVSRPIPIWCGRPVMHPAVVSCQS